MFALHGQLQSTWKIKKMSFSWLVIIFIFTGVVALEVVCRKGILRNFAKLTGKSLCLIMLEALGLQFYLRRKTLVQVFSCAFCEISKNTFLQNTPSNIKYWKIFKFVVFFIKNIFLLLWEIAKKKFENQKT